MTTPVWCTGAGRALLWDLDNAAITSMLREVEFVGVGGPRAAHSTEEVITFLERDRARGYSSAVEEFEQGLSEIALPIRDPGGRVVAALSVVTRPLQQNVRERLVVELSNAGHRINEMTAGD